MASAHREASRSDPTQSVSVVVCTYMRTGRLAACLAGLRAQTRAADEVIVVVHTSDEESASFLMGETSGWRELRIVRAQRRGTVEAYNLGLREAQGAIVAYVDDDAVPAAEWLERIVDRFAEDERIAAVGGRDVVFVDGGVLGAPPPRFDRRSRGSLEVGRIQWFGRMIANHHLGSGEARDVDVLKGVNMSFRREAVLGHGFDERLLGAGATVHSELSVCLPLRRSGRRVVYDPRITVNHYPAPRLYGEDRDDLSHTAVFSQAHNEALEILDYLRPAQRVVFAIWSVVVGATAAPGIAVLVRDLIGGRPAAARRFIVAQHGRAAAWSTRRKPRLAMVTATRSGTAMQLTYTRE